MKFEPLDKETITTINPPCQDFEVNRKLYDSAEGGYRCAKWVECKHYSSKCHQTFKHTFKKGNSSKWKSLECLRPKVSKPKDIPARPVKKPENIEIIIAFTGQGNVTVIGLDSLCYGQAKYLHKLFGEVKQKLSGGES